MNMEIKLLKNKGVILTRQPEVIFGNLYITFTGAPKDATAIFETADGDSLYKKLEDCMCSLPESFLQGEIKITVVVLDGTTNAPKWSCEEIKATKQKRGVLVCPNDMNIPQKMVDIQIEMQEIKDDMKKLFDKYSELNTKLEKLLEGYDIT